MDNDSVLYILMNMRVNGVLNRIPERDTEYQEIIQKNWMSYICRQKSWIWLTTMSAN